MTGEQRRAELEKALRQSRRALPSGIVFGVVGVGAIWGLQAWLQFPAWLAWVVGTFAVIGAVVDAINIPYCKRELRRLEGERTS